MRIQHLATRACDALHRIADTGAVVSLLGIIAVVTLQVASRFLLDTAPPWTEEAARFLFLYMVGFGLAHGARSGALVRLELLGRFEGKPAYSYLRAAVDMAVGLLSLCLCVYAWRFAANGASEHSPALGLSMAAALASVLVMFFSVFVFSIERSLHELARARAKQ